MGELILIEDNLIRQNGFFLPEKDVNDICDKFH